MWTNIEIKNFRVIGEEGLSLSLAPLTVFVGENGTGKSTILEAMALTAQTVHAPQNRRGLVLSGELIDLPVGKEGGLGVDHLYHKKEAERTMAVELEWSEDDARLYPPNVPFLWKDLTWPPQKISYRWEFISRPLHQRKQILKSQGIELAKQWQEIKKHNKNSYITHDWTQVYGFPGQFSFNVPDEWLGQHFPIRPFDAPRTWEEHQIGEMTPQEHREQFDMISDALHSMVDILRKALKHVSVLLPLRGLQLIQKDIGPDVQIVGKHGEQTFRFLASLQSQRHPGFAMLQKWAACFGMKDLKAAWAGGQQLKVDFLDPYNNALLEADEGATGSRQMLMLLTHLLLAPQPMTCIVEEPECNLHPAYEKQLPALFADSIRQGNQLLITTHSEIIIAALGQAVRSGKLKASDVKIWHLERHDSQIHAKEIPISDRGRLQGWVESFAKVEEDLFHEWLEESPADENEMGS